MTIDVDELLKLRKDLIAQAKDDHGYVHNDLIMQQVLPDLFEAKLVETEEYEECFHALPSGRLSINGFINNESGERLQIFMLDKASFEDGANPEDLKITQKSTYEKSFKHLIKFIKASINGDMKDKLQDSSSIQILTNHLCSQEGLNQIDTIELFLVTYTATVTIRANQANTKSMHFDDENITVKLTKRETQQTKDLLVLRRVIDLNYIYNVQMSRGNQEPLEVRFDKILGHGINTLQAASESGFKSYLCVFPAKTLVDLYKRYSSRLLEKNVRSFLQFNEVNKGIKRTIRKEPEKFLAYNNGLTITATEAKIRNNKGALQITSLTDFQIVNGGQTTATLYFSHKDGLDLDKVSVMVKINVLESKNEKELDELVSDISRYSNAQSRVSKVDLNSRNKELIKFKKLSDSVTTPSAKRWFFELHRGQHKTKIRMGNKNQILKEFPRSRLISKSDLAKYYSAWGKEPYKVKKGGEKIFRHFIELLSEEDGTHKITVDRDFYENTIAKIILFKSMENIHGVRNNAIGQLRAAVIPYSLSIIYIYTDDGNKKHFNMQKIWKDEKLSDDFSNWLKSLMLLMYDLIKKYSISDDYNENSKKIELWNSIAASAEIKDFMSSKHSLKSLSDYTVDANL